MLLKPQSKSLARESGRLPLLLQIQSFSLIPRSIEDCPWQLSLPLLPPFLVDHTDLPLQAFFCPLIALPQLSVPSDIPKERTGRASQGNRYPNSLHLPLLQTLSPSLFDVSVADHLLQLPPFCAPSPADHTDYFPPNSGLKSVKQKERRERERKRKKEK